MVFIDFDSAQATPSTEIVHLASGIEESDPSLYMLGTTVALLNQVNESALSLVSENSIYERLKRIKNNDRGLPSIVYAIGQKDYEVVELLIRLGETGLKGVSLAELLEDAEARGDEELVTIIRQNATPFMIFESLVACEETSLKALAKQINTFSAEECSKALMIATSKNHQPLVLLLMSMGTKPSLSHLEIAIDKGHDKIAFLFINCGLMPGVNFNDRWLLHATEKASLFVIKNLLEKNLVSEEGKLNAEKKAYELEEYDVLETLQQTKLLVPLEKFTRYFNNERKWPALHYAIDQGELEDAKALLEQYPEQANLCTVGVELWYLRETENRDYPTFEGLEDGYSALELAVCKGADEDLLLALIQAGANPRAVRKEYFHFSETIPGHSQPSRKWKSYGPSSSHYLFTPLYFAITKNNTVAAKVLLDQYVELSNVYFIRDNWQLAPDSDPRLREPLAVSKSAYDVVIESGNQEMINLIKEKVN